MERTLKLRIYSLEEKHRKMDKRQTDFENRKLDAKFKLFKDEIRQYLRATTN